MLVSNGTTGDTVVSSGGGGVVIPSLADRQAAAKARQATRAVARRGIPVKQVGVWDPLPSIPVPSVPGNPPALTPPAPITPFMSPRAATQDRAAERKIQRDAKKATLIAASG